MDPFTCNSNEAGVKASGSSAKREHEWKVAKYAPVKYKGEKDQELVKKKEERDKYYLAKKEQDQINTEELREKALKKFNDNKISPEKSIKKEEARKYYKIRQEKMKDKCLLSSEISITLNQRITGYGRHHDCECGLKFNVIEKPEKEGERYKVSCNHKKSIKISSKTKMICNHCGHKIGSLYNTPFCGCHYYVCNRCRYSTYIYENKNGDYYQMFDKHGSNCVIKESPMAPRDKITPNFDKEEKEYVDIQKFVNDSTKVKKLTEVQKENFYRELKNNKILSYSKVANRNIRKDKEKKTLTQEEWFDKYLTPEERQELSDKIYIPTNFPYHSSSKPIATFNKFEALKEEDFPPLVLNNEDFPPLDTNTKITKEEAGFFDRIVGTKKKIDKKKEIISDKLGALKEKIEESSEMAQVKSIINKMIDSVKRTKQSMLESYIVKKIKNIAAQMPLVYELGKFFDTLVYVFKVLRDYIDISNLALIIDLITNFNLSLVGGVKSAIKLTMLYNIIKRNEERSFREFEMRLLQMATLAENHPLGINDFFVTDFGCFTSIIRKRLHEELGKMDVAILEVKKIGDKYLYKVKSDDVIDILGQNIKYKDISIITKLNFLTSTNINTVESDLKRIMAVDKTLKEMETNEQTSPIFSIISGFCSLIPKSFGPGIKMVSEFAKILLPTLSLIKVGSDVASILSKAIDKFIEWWTNDTKNPKDWINNKLYTPGNPLNDLQCAYMSYRASLGLGKTLGVDSNQLRIHYYEKRRIAEVYVNEHQMYSPAFKSILQMHDMGMIEVGSPKERDFEPTVLCLFGAPGSGKSTVWPILVARALGLDEDENALAKIKDTTYTWSIGNEFQTGMSGKKIILFDDFGQDKTKNDEALNLIQLVTTAPYAINSANIVGPEVKGQFVYPEIVVICTNDADFASSQIFDKGAVKRRMDIVVEMNQKFDILKIKEPTINVVKCPTYPKFEKQAISVSQLATVFTVIDSRKKSNFKKLRNEIDGVIKNDDLLTNVTLTDALKIDASTFVADTGDFLKDLKNYTNLVDTAKQLKISKTDTIKIVKELNVDNVPQDAILCMLKGGKVSIEQAGDNEMIAYLMSIMRKSFEVGVTLTSSMAVIMAWAGVSVDMINFQLSFSWVKNVARKALIASLITLGTCSMFALYAKFANRSEDESGQTKTAKTANKQVGIFPTMDSIPQANAALLNMIEKACGVIRRSDGTCVNVIFIGGHYILTVNHFFQDYGTSGYIQDGDIMKITKKEWNGRLVEFEFKRENLIPIQDGYNIISGKTLRQDVIIYELDKRIFNASKQIWHHFWDADYNVKNHRVTKIDYMSQYFANVDTDTYELSSGKVIQDKILTSRVKGKDVYWHMCAEADYANRPSSCGSPIISEETENQFILGIHIAVGLNGNSFFHFVTKSGIEQALNNRINMTFEEKGIVSVLSKPPLIPEGSVLVYQGEVKRNYQNDKTDLVPSTIFELFGPHITEPAPLSPTDSRLAKADNPDYVRRNFYKILFEGYKQNPSFLYSDLKEAATYLKQRNRAIKNSSIVPQRLLSIDEAINGISHLPANTAIDLTTSPGYPYTIQNIRRTDLFIKEEKPDGTFNIIPKERIKQEYINLFENLKKGVIPFTPFALTIKDERIKLKKIYKNLKPRLFSSANILHLLVMRSFYYSHVMAHYHANETYAATKFDRLSLDWHDFVMYMIEVNDKGYDLDFQFFDRTIAKMVSYIGSEIGLDYIKRDIINKFGYLFYRTFLEWDTSPEYVFMTHLFIGMGTWPSGHFTTYQKNCDMNELLHISGYLSLARKFSPLMATCENYRMHNRGKRGGDDTIQVASDTVLQFFNGQTFAQWLNDRGMHATASDKGDIIPFQPFKDLSFLKNKTGFSRGFYIPLTDKESVYEMMNWCRQNAKNRDIHKATQDNIQAALRSLYFYGKDEYNAVRNTILNKFPFYSLNTYEENKTIWSTYFYFPGSHSDYATRSDQGIDQVINGAHKFDSSPLMGQHLGIMEEIETKYEAGLDKASKDIETTTPNVSVNNVDDLSSTVAKNPDIMVEEVNKTRSEQIGTTIQEAEHPIIGAPITAGKKQTSLNMRAEMHCNDINWTLKDLETKYTMIKQQEWTIADGRSKTLMFLNLPNDILITPAQKTPFDVTAFWRAKAVKIRVIVKSSDFYSGSLAVGFYPSLRTSTDKEMNTFVDPSILIQIGGQILHVCDNQAVEFEVPFRHILGFTEAPNDCLGQFIVKVLNPLRTGAQNDNSVLVTAYAAIINSEFKVPEFVPVKQYSSFKFAKTKEESGMEERQIVASNNTGQISINDPVSKMHPTMLCAGEGYVKEPKVKQFQDHPIDLVQLRKRYRLLTVNQYPIKAGDYVYADLSVSELREALIGPWLSEQFVLNRGSINLKIQCLVTTGSNVNYPFGQNVTGRVFLVQRPGTPYETDYQAMEIDGAYDGGSHYFSADEPAEFMIPYLSPVFTATNYLEPQDALFQVQNNLIIELTNYNAEVDVVVTLKIIGCLGDDFAMGLYVGTPSTLIPEDVQMVEESGKETFKAYLVQEETEKGRSYVMHYKESPPKPLSIEEIFDKAERKSFLTKPQIRKLVNYFIDKISNNNGQIFLENYYKSDEWIQILFKNNIISEREQNIITKHCLGMDIAEGFVLETRETEEQAGLIEFIDKAIDTTLPIVENVDALMSLLDAHPVTYQPYPIKTKKMGYTISTDNVQYLERMLVTNHNGMSLSDKEAFGGKQKETDMYDLMRNTKTLIDTIEWNTSIKAGSNLLTLPVGPSLSKSGLYAAPPMDVFSSNFWFWNGSITYVIDIAATKMHKGQLTVSFHPNLNEFTAPSSLEEATQQYFTSFDLTDGRATIALTIPYLQKIPYLNCETKIPSIYDTKYNNNGIIVLWVQNALRATNVVDSTVDINIYKMAGPDFKFDVYGSSLNYLYKPASRKIEQEQQKQTTTIVPKIENGKKKKFKLFKLK